MNHRIDSIVYFYLRSKVVELQTKLAGLASSSVASVKTATGATTLVATSTREQLKVGSSYFSTSNV